ncbi:MAG: response regulator [Betaproteobacteria bacterium]|nr:response regulator [Betaproteobacteria bacterium]
MAARRRCCARASARARAARRGRAGQSRGVARAAGASGPRRWTRPEDGEQALELARHRPYALILMDMQMPRMNGLEATRLLRADPRFASVPILALTANAFDDDRAACLEAGMNDHLGKPIEPERLYGKVLEWLSRR